MSFGFIVRPLLGCMDVVICRRFYILRYICVKYDLVAMGIALPRVFSWWLFPIQVLPVSLETKVFLTGKFFLPVCRHLAYFMKEV